MTYRNPNQARVALYPSLVSVAKEGDGTDASRDQELRCQDGVHLTDELVADVDRSLGHGAAELEVIRQVAMAILAAARDAANKARMVVVYSCGSVGLV